MPQGVAALSKPGFQKLTLAGGWTWLLSEEFTSRPESQEHGISTSRWWLGVLSLWVWKFKKQRPVSVCAEKFFLLSFILIDNN